MLPRRIPKQKKRDDRWRSPAHCNFVRSHECSVPSCQGRPIEVAHVRNVSDAGLSRKPSDWFTISLCRHHHSQQHSVGEKSFAEMHRIDLHALAKAFAEASPKRFEIIQKQIEREAA
jgi:hypothetical protein